MGTVADPNTFAEAHNL